MTRPQGISFGLGRLVGSVGEVLGVRDATASRLATKDLAEIMAAAMEDTALLPEAVLKAPSASGFGKYLLSRGPDHVLVATVTVPGCPVPPHDHGDWGVVGLYRGLEEEIHFEFDDATGLAETGRRRYRAGEVMVIPPPPDDVHQVLNRGVEPTVSIHLHPHDFVARGFRMFIAPDYRAVATGPLEYDKIPQKLATTP